MSFGCWRRCINITLILCRQSIFHLFSQVAQADFEKLNEFAEAAVLVRNPGQEKEIKERRRKLTDQ